jgi:hypothetical protein
VAWPLGHEIGEAGANGAEIDQSCALMNRRRGAMAAFAKRLNARCCASIASIPRALDRLDVVNAAAIPLRADPTAIRCGEIVEQVGHRIVRTMSGD